ncbi:Gfo/Idh/MocA family oxidoreductase [bacterium]|nr:Gfo/Idh/MocA family oxidoreductase [bacterium]
MQALRFAVLGAGGVAHSHVGNLTALPEVSPVGFQDISVDALRGWQERFPQAEIDADPKRLLARTKPDLVCVCSPNSSHESLTMTALAAGCHVLCEKPMAMNVAQARRMEARRAKDGKLGAINFSYRHVAAFRFAREVIRRGELGRVQRLNVRYLQSFLGAAATPHSWRNDLSIAGFGALGDLGAHMIDGATFVSGLRPVRAIGTMQTLVPFKRDRKGRRRRVTTDTNASFLIEYESGAIGTFEASQVVPGYGNFFHIEVSGDQGLLRICSQENDQITLLSGATVSQYATWATAGLPKMTIPTDFTGRQPRNTQEVFVRAIRGEKIEFATFADGLLAQRVLDALVASTTSRRWVTL